MGNKTRLIEVPVAGFKAAVTFHEGAQKNSLTIIALHGFTGSGQDFLPLRQSLGEDRFHWACVDFMGHGLSDSPGTIDPYLLRNALGLVDAARQIAPNPRQVCLLGYSMGGRIALHYLKWAKPLPAILIGATPGIEDPAERAERRATDAGWIKPKRTSVSDFCDRWEAQPLIRQQTQLPEPIGSELATRRRNNNLSGLQHSLLALGSGVLPSLWNDLANLPPALCLFGDKDHKFGRIAHLMETRNCGLNAVKVPGCGHAPHLEDPGTLATLLADFLLSR